MSAPTRDPREAAPRRHRPTVLVIDDDADQRLLAQVQLEDRYEVVPCASGRDAVGMALQHDPDVILLDLMMPGMDGQQVLAALSDDPRTKDIPVIFLSAHDRADQRVKALEAGAVDYITKLADPRELAARVGVAARAKARSDRASSVDDRVTALPGRDQFERRLAEEVARTKRNGSSFSILLLDVDHMSSLNARFGRSEGDAVLRQLAIAIRDTVRGADPVFRYGGDEFVVLLADADIATAHRAAERLRRALGALTSHGRAITLSIGIAEFAQARTGEDLLSAAASALLGAKESGGDQAWRADRLGPTSFNGISLSQELTEREWEVLGHLAQRRNEPEIARMMDISAGTVRSHKARIRRKLHVPSDVRLGDFARANFAELSGRIDDPPGSGTVRSL